MPQDPNAPTGTSAVGSVAGGVLDALNNYITGERQRRRDQEDQQIQGQMDLINHLISRPDVNPQMIGKALHDLVDLHNAKTSTRKLKSGTEGVLGSTELPISQFLRGIASGETPIMPGSVPGINPASSQAAPTNQPSAQDTAGAVQSEYARDLSSKAPEGSTAPTAPQPGVQAAMVPPPPLPGPPQNTALAGAGTDMLKFGQPPPAAGAGTPAMQPPPQALLRTPEDMAQQAGMTEGITEGAKKRADIQARRLEVAEYIKSGGQLSDAQKAAYIFNVPASLQRPVYKTGPDGTLMKINQMDNTSEPVQGPDGLPLKVHVGGAADKLNQMAQAMVESGKYPDLPTARKAAGQQMLDQALLSIQDKKLSIQLRQKAFNGELTGKDSIKIAQSALAATGRTYTTEDVQDLAREYMSISAGNASGEVAPSGDTTAGSSVASSAGGTGASAPNAALPTPPNVDKGLTSIANPPASGQPPTGSAFQPSAAHTLLGPQKLDNTQRQVISGIDVVRAEAAKVIQKIEQSGVLKGKDANNPIPMKMSQWLYKMGVDPQELTKTPFGDVAELLQDVGVQEAYGLRGLIAGRPNIKLIDIFEKHLAQGGDTPQLMYKKLKEIVQPGGIADTVVSAVQKAAIPPRVSKVGGETQQGSSLPSAPASKVISRALLNQYAQEHKITPEAAQKIFEGAKYHIVEQ